MTRLESADSSNDDQNPSTSREVHLDLYNKSSASSNVDCDLNNEKHIGNYPDNPSNLEDDNEPLGYQRFLCDVNIEYSPGGHLPNLIDNKHCFRMKCLPYMVVSNRDPLTNARNNSEDDINECDTSDGASNDSPRCKYVTNCYSDDMIPVDVTRTTCAFLSNSEYVPTTRLRQKYVVLEMIAAKLSQPSNHNLSANSSSNNLITLAERSPPQSIETTSLNDPLDTNGENVSIRSSSQQPASSTSSSRKYVNYKILIKTAPGLDRHPAVIERRFSDFLALYQGLKGNQEHARILDKYVTFPKKVYVGNFSLVKIAERSIEFNRLLTLCMKKTSLLWSVPFISFLVDKELKQAHILSLFGDPDDVQALIETVYYIEQKLYIQSLQVSGRDSSPSSMNSSSQESTRYSTNIPNGMHTLSNDTISASSSPSNVQRFVVSDPSPTQTNSVCDSSENSDVQNKSSFSPLNQRILVTFCILFVVYSRTNNCRDLRQIVQEFNNLISSQDYIDSLINTRHHVSLRACLLFLMNLNRDDLIDQDTRLWLKRRLEDIDGLHAELDENNHQASRINDKSLAGGIRTRRFTSNDDPLNSNNRVTKRDLTSLLRDRNFCSFQDEK